MACAEKVGPNYDREQMYVARRLTFDAINEIARQIRPGMVEEDGVGLAKSTLKQLGLLRGWQLNLKVAGHRLADFPHKALHAGDLASTNFKPTSDLWVLEIQIKHPQRPFGAFYEDLLLDTQPVTHLVG